MATLALPFLAALLSVSVQANNITSFAPAATGLATSSSATLVTTTALPGDDTPPSHWTPDRPDPYVCEYLGENDCWRPSLVEEGPPYMGFDTSSGRDPGYSGRPWQPQKPSGDGPPYMGWGHNPRPPRTKTCVVKTHNDPSKDDAPYIVQAFQECKENSNIIFKNTTYYIFSVMNTTGLRNVDVELKGTLEWNNDDIDYWLANSLPIGFQNQTSAWHFGGDHVHFYGHGYGTFNGNGQVWYLYNNGRSNLHGRPHQITFTASQDCVIEGINFLKAQMWTTVVSFSERILLQDIYINNTCVPGEGTFPACNLNTDGSDTMYANNITFLRWTIDNGDDAISLKQNSTNIYVADCKFYSGQGIALGSIGQYPGQIGVMENFTARNIECYHTTYGAYLKSWTGLSKGYPPNGGGGGYGFAKNLTFENFTLSDVSKAWYIDQSQSYNGQPGGENTSRFKFQDAYYINARGTLQSPVVTSFQCSAAAPCTGLTISNNEFTVSDTGAVADSYLCSNVQDQEGFECTGSV